MEKIGLNENKNRDEKFTLKQRRGNKNLVSFSGCNNKK